MLKPRLKFIAKEVPSGARVVDVGTDHGYLPVFLWQRGDIKSLIASDINEQPLCTAKENIKAAGAEIKTVLCDGLKGISADEVDTVIIAGMGGDTISDILAACEWIKDSNKLLLLQPMSSADSLRKYLFTEGFSIEWERCVKDSGRIYPVLKVRFNKTPHEPSVCECFIGGLDKNMGDLEREYLTRVLASFIRKKESIEKSPRMREELLPTNAVIDRLKTILGE